MAIRFEYITIAGDKRTTKFMQAADVWEKFKVHGVVQQVHVEIECKEDVIYKVAAAYLLHIVKSYEETGHICSFVHLVRIVNGDTIHLNTQGKVPYWRNREVRAISDGKKWGMLEECVEKVCGLKIEPLEWPARIR